jgi:hypothetical protein
MRSVILVGALALSVISGYAADQLMGQVTIESTEDAVYRAIREVFGQADVEVVVENVDGETRFLTGLCWGSREKHCARIVLAGSCTSSRANCKDVLDGMCAGANHGGVLAHTVKVREHLDGSKTCSGSCNDGSGAQAFCITKK